MSADLAAVAQRLLANHRFVAPDPSALHQVLLQCPERAYRDGEVLCKERSYGDEMWFLVAGRVKVVRRDIRNNEHLVAVVEAPDLIGPLALIDNTMRSATVVADGPVVTRVLDRGAYVQLSTAATTAGAVLRRLLLSSLHQQLSRTHGRIRTLGAPARPGSAPPPPAQAAPPPTVQILDEEEIDDLALVELTEEEAKEAFDILSTNG